MPTLIGSFKAAPCKLLKRLWGEKPKAAPIPSSGDLHQRLDALSPDQNANEVLTNWMRQLYTEEPLVIAAQIGTIHPDYIGGGRDEAQRRRSCAQAVLDAKLAEQAALQAERLELASRRLQIVGAVLAILTLFATIVALL